MRNFQLLLCACAAAMVLAKPMNPFVEQRKNYVPPEIAIFDWVRANGGIVDGIAIFSPKNKPRGLYTTKQFKNDTLMLSIPNEVMIHKDFVLSEKKNPAFAAFFQGHVEYAPFPGDDCALNALYIMFEMFYNRRETRIGPYLDLLPLFDTNFQYFQYLPSFWPSEIKALFDTLPSSRFEFAKREEQIVNIERYVRSVLYPYFSKEYIVESADVLYSQFRWAMSIVQSRAWGGLGAKDASREDVHVDTPLSGTCTVVPLADMLNHHTDAMALGGVQDTVDGESYLVGHGIKAIKDYDAGEEIFDNYSPLEDTELCTINILITFGFLEPLQGYDCYKFLVNASLENADFRKEKRELFRLFGISPDLNVHLRGSNIETMREYFPEDYMIFMRIMAIQSRDEYESGLRVVRGIQSGTYTKDIAWSLENEHRALQSLKRHAETLAKTAFATTIEEDADLIRLLDEKMNDPSITSARAKELLRQQKIIVEMRRREHELLYTFVDFIKERWMRLLDAN